MDINNELLNLINKIRNIRNLLLLSTDKYLLSDYPITNEELLIIKQYRTDLRNYINNNYDNFLTYKFYDLPIKPDCVTIEQYIPTSISVLSNNIIPINIIS